MARKRSSGKVSFNEKRIQQRTESISAKDVAYNDTKIYSHKIPT